MISSLIELFLKVAIFVATMIGIIILSTYLYLLPELPRVDNVDQSKLQIPLKIYTSDEKLIGEFGEKKRRPLDFQEIPEDLKNAFLAAEDDGFFEHRGVSYPSLIRAFSQYIRVGLDATGGGTITMQVVRNYLLTREKKVRRKIKEIFLAFHLESSFSKQEIFEIYVNTIFLGNRSYGIEAAANTYFGKSVGELSIAESALIASLAQLPSRVNPIRNPERTKARRNWVLYRMKILNFITEQDYVTAINSEINLPISINNYDLEASHLAELARFEVINRYGIRAYEEGWSVYTTIDSELQKRANEAITKRLFEYDKRHGWRDKKNYADQLGNEFFNTIEKEDFDFLISQDYVIQSDPIDYENLSEKVLRNIFEENSYVLSHQRAIVIEVWDSGFRAIDEEFNFEKIDWDDSYIWAREFIDENRRGAVPKGFTDLLQPGDLIYLTKENDQTRLDQIPLAQSSLISFNPKSGEVQSYVGGSVFNDSQFDRVRQSYPQSGSVFKPFIYASALSGGYNPSSLINDAPIIFEDENLETFWRPENYSGKFYGLTTLREALVQSINIVSIKLLREIGVKKSSEIIDNFGFNFDRLPQDLSLALGSGNFSPAEVARGFSVFANDGVISDIHYVRQIRDKNDNIIFDHSESNDVNISSISAFPWLNTVQLDASKPYFLLPPINKAEPVIDPRVAFMVKDILKEASQRGSNGRLTRFLDRKDFAGKTGTTNDAVSTWFSGFNSNIVTTVWVGNDDFESLGDNEFGSTTALPIWVDYMDFAFKKVDIDEFTLPDGISYVRINKKTGELSKSAEDESYFELFLREDL